MKLVKQKIFIGLEDNVIKKLNDKDSDFFNLYSCQERYINDTFVTKYLDSDGILIVKSQDGRDQQIEEIFTEKIVESRLGLFGNYFKRESHECGSPCTSRRKEGQPCKKKTFRDHCHFHR